MTAIDRAIEALKTYANPDNWCCDNQGIARIWYEPDSTTPTAYCGFESAMHVLNDIAELQAVQAVPEVHNIKSVQIDEFSVTVKFGACRPAQAFGRFIQSAAPQPDQKG